MLKKAVEMDRCDAGNGAEREVLDRGEQPRLAEQHQAEGGRKKCGCDQDAFS